MADEGQDQGQAVAASAKAWDYKALLKKIEADGLPVVESAAMQIINSTLDWVQDSITKSDNKFDDAALMFLPAVKAYALKLADKIAKAEVPENAAMVADAGNQAQAVGGDLHQGPTQPSFAPIA